MIHITNDIPGGNIEVLSVDENANPITANLAVELRDTKGDWFYWAFKVTGAEGKTVKFQFEKNERVGYYGAAVSHDFKEWHWQYTTDDCAVHTFEGSSFTYTFSHDENEVYFAHDMLYRPERFYELALQNGIAVNELCKTKKGRSVPCFSIGKGTKKVLLTSRHHACESTGSYVLEGVISALCEKPIEGYEFFVVPMTDFDGVCDGDQGKNRIPHDHNRDYDPAVPSIYNETAAIRRFIGQNEVVLGIDFHSPWHFYNDNDKVFIVEKGINKLGDIRRFSRLLEANLTPDSMKYHPKDNYPPDTGWNLEGSPTASYCVYINGGVGFTLETTYYGEKDNVFTVERAIALGKCARNAIEKYLLGEDVEE